MSHTIVDDRQVIKTPTGYTFAVLHGDNNVTTGHGKYEKRARDWSCWILNKTEQEVEEYFSDWLNRTNEHFKTLNGKWVDDAALVRWYKTGLKNAKTIEEIRALAPNQALHLLLSIWDKSKDYKDPDYHRAENVEWVQTTEDFLAWVAKAEERIANKKESESIYIKTGFHYDEPLKLPKNSTLEGPVLAMYGKKCYIIELSKDGYWKTASPDITQAIVFDSVEAARKACHSTGKSIKFISAERKEKAMAEGLYVIQMDKDGKSSYIEYCGRGYLSQVHNAEYAQKYTKQAANAFIRNHQGQYIGTTFKAVPKADLEASA